MNIMETMTPYSNDELSERDRAVLTAYTGKMFVIRFRDLQDYADELFGYRVPLKMFVSPPFMTSLAEKAEEDFLNLPEHVQEMIHER